MREAPPCTPRYGSLFAHAPAFPLLSSYEQHRHRRFAQHALGVAAEEQPVEPTPPVRAHDDQIGAPRIRAVEYDLRE